MKKRTKRRDADCCCVRRVLGVLLRNACRS